MTQSLRLGSLVLVLFTAASYISAQEISAAQKEVWQMEETYWKDVKELNATHYMSLWHADFLGWPQDQDHPVVKKEIAQIVRKRMAGTTVVSYEFMSKAVTVVGNVAITQYSVRVVSRGEKSEPQTRVSRLTHTWLKTDSGWQIIGGMSAPYEMSHRTW